jgi:SAM-dependent methyltransferase
VIVNDQPMSRSSAPAAATREGSGMLGQAIGGLRGPLSARFQRWYGVADLHARQKWNILWPRLAELPERGLSVLDAGCGDGIWSFEMAARRPGWQIQGIDLDAPKIAWAQQARQRLNVPNAEFAVADFLKFTPAKPVDLVLSVASAHYLAQIGRGPELLGCFRRWLRPGGTLVLYGPRHLPESPVAAWLPKLSGEWGFTRQQLQDWCGEAGLTVNAIEPAVGRLGTIAKQIAIRSGASTPLRAATYPLTLALDWVDRRRQGGERASSAWCLIATRTLEKP